MTTFDDVPKNERLGPSDPVGVSYTVGDLINRLSRLNPELPIFSGLNNSKGLALHHHAFVDPSRDYVSFTHLDTLKFTAQPPDKQPR